MDISTVTGWLERYVKAWKSYDPAQIAGLFSEDAHYYYTPFSAPLEGCAAIVASWLEAQDAPGTYDAQYTPVMIVGSRAIANGRSYYYAEDGITLEREFDNIFMLEFDDLGRCTLFREWYFDRADADV